MKRGEKISHWIWYVFPQIQGLGLSGTTAYFSIKDIEEAKGNLGIGCISDSDSQPLLINSHLGSFAISTIGRINNLEEIKKICFDYGKVQFLEMSGGELNQTEVVAASI